MSSKPIKCPKCARHFATKAALAQHTRDAHGSGQKAGGNRQPKARTARIRSEGTGITNALAPMSFASIVKTPIDGRGVVVSGEDFIMDLSVDSEVAPGLPLAQLRLEPEGWAGTHLQLLGRAYERFRFLKCQFIITARAPTTVGGGYIAGCTPDALIDFVGQTPLAVKHAIRALPGAVSSPWYGAVSVPFPCGESDKWYHTNENVPGYKTIQGLFVIAVDTPPGNYTGPLGITVSCRWQVAFSTPIVSPPTDAAEGGQRVAAQTFASFGTEGDKDYLYASGVWDSVWNVLPYKKVFRVSPPFSVLKDGVRARYITLGKTEEGSKVIGLFTDLEKARAEAAKGEKGYHSQLRFEKEDFPYLQPLTHVMSVDDAVRMFSAGRPHSSLGGSWESNLDQGASVSGE